MKQDIDLYKLCDAVCDETSFIAFLEQLRLDFGDSKIREAKHPSPSYAAAANGWENTTIDAFLEAATAWARTGINQSTIPGSVLHRSFLRESSTSDAGLITDHFAGDKTKQSPAYDSGACFVVFVSSLRELFLTV